MKQITKTEADYRGGSLKMKCALCTMFRPPQKCTLVKGEIRPTGLCDYFKSK